MKANETALGTLQKTMQESNKSSIQLLHFLGIALNKQHKIQDNATTEINIAKTKQIMSRLIVMQELIKKTHILVDEVQTLCGDLTEKPSDEAAAAAADERS